MPAPPSPIEHVIVLMLENRSFDHMLGMLPGVNGLLGKDGKLDPSHYNRANPADDNSKKYPVNTQAEFAIAQEDVDDKGFGGPGHSYPDATVQVYGSKNPPTAAQLAQPAPLNGFVLSYINELKAGVKVANPTDAEINEPISVFTPDRLPVISQLASEFCVCDQWYSEVPGPTQPNRLFVHAATSTGLTHNVWNLPINARTIYEELDKAGHDWAFYYYDLSDSDSFPALKGRVDRILRFDAFTQMSSAGTLPTYSFLCPRYADTPQGDKANSQHAPYDVRYGEDLIADVYEALRNGPLWEKSLLIVTYDEHGGYYDHVPPPTTGVSNPDGLNSPTDYDQEQAKENPKKNGYLLQPPYQFDFRRLGVRVPAVLISPWIPKGKVDSTRYQHTSIMAALRDLYGVGTLTKRDAEAASFAGVLSLKKPRTDAPTKLERPAIESAKQDTSQRPLTERQKDLWPMLSHLDGHKDSGTVTRPPKTRAAAHAYIQERLAAHESFHRARRRKAVYQVHRENAKSYRWKLHAEDGTVLAVSPGAYASQQEAEAAIAKIRDLAPYARQVSASVAAGGRR